MLRAPKISILEHAKIYNLKTHGLFLTLHKCSLQGLLERKLKLFTQIYHGTSQTHKSLSRDLEPTSKSSTPHRNKIDAQMSSSSTYFSSTQSETKNPSVKVNQKTNTVLCAYTYTKHQNTNRSSIKNEVILLV